MNPKKNKIHCPYCQKPCRQVQHSTYQCDYHGAVRVMVYFKPYPATAPDIQHCISLVCWYKNYNYQATFFHGLTKEDDIKFTISQMHFDSSKPSIIVCQLNFHPAITPDNFQDKIPTLITFS